MPPLVAFLLDILDVYSYLNISRFQHGLRKFFYHTFSVSCEKSFKSQQSRHQGFKTKNRFSA